MPQERGIETSAADDGMLPAWRRVLVVVAHPDDESFGLGGLIGAFAEAGSEVTVECLTRGESSTLGAADVDLAAIRSGELGVAARRLGVADIALHDLPDGRLARHLSEARRLVERAVERVRPEGLLVFDPVAGVTGHLDHEAASRAAALVAAERGLPVLGWALPASVAATLNAELGTGFAGHQDLDLAIVVDRRRQRRAILAHASQAVPGSALWPRLELSGSIDHCRWLGAAPIRSSAR